MKAPASAVYKATAGPEETPLDSVLPKRSN